MKNSKSILLSFAIMMFLIAGCGTTQTINPTIPTQTTSPAITPTEQMESPETPIATTIPHLPRGTELKLNKIEMLTLTNGWAVGTGAADANEHIFHTMDGGTTWDDVTPPESNTDPNGKQAGTFFMDDLTAWVSYFYNQPVDENTTVAVWATHDGGETWVESKSIEIGLIAAEWYNPDPIFFADVQHGWLMAHVGVGMSHDYVILFSTSDGGNTWQKLLDPYEDHGMPMVITKNGMMFTDSLHGWVTGDSRGLTTGRGVFPVVTSDGGRTWSPLNISAPADSINLFTDQTNSCGFQNPISFTNQLMSFQMVCNSFDNSFQASWLYVTNTGGQTWMSKSLPSGIGSVYFLDPATGWYVADGKIHQTSDYGKNWNQITTVAWNGMPDFVTKTDGWLIATNEMETALVRTADGGISWTLIEPVVGE